MSRKQFCERAAKLEERGINTEMFCNCTGNLNCTALPKLQALISCAGGCCEIGYPRDVKD